MTISSKMHIIERLTKSAKRMQSVRAAAEAERVSTQFAESEPRPLNANPLGGGLDLQKQS